MLQVYIAKPLAQISLSAALCDLLRQTFDEEC
jgi:hypothetical protein